MYPSLFFHSNQFIYQVWHWMITVRIFICQTLIQNNFYRGLYLFSWWSIFLHKFLNTYYKIRLSCRSNLLRSPTTPWFCRKKSSLAYRVDLLQSLDNQLNLVSITGHILIFIHITIANLRKFEILPENVIMHNFSRFKDYEWPPFLCILGRFLSFTLS